MKLDLAPGWTADVERGPEWLFVRLHTASPTNDASPVSERLWEMLEKEFANRLVIEMDDLPILPSQLIGELVRLQGRICSHGGLLRLAGLSRQNYRALQTSRLGERFPHFATREEAVMGRRPPQPR